MPLLLGTAPNQVPTNADLGTMAFQDQASVNIQGGLVQNATISPANVTAYQLVANSYPSTPPSLMLDFANSKTLDPRITFTRASTATYYDGVTNAVAEQNLLTQSQAIGSTNWTLASTTATTNNAVAPDGTTTGSLITAAAATAAHYVSQTFTTAISQVITASFYAKAGTNNYIQFAAGADLPVANFDLSAGTVGTTTSVTSATIISVGSSWYRCVVTYTAAIASTSVVISLVPSSSATRIQSWAAAGTETIFLWGAQLEQRSAVTAYTPTTTAAITNYIPVLQTAASGVARLDYNPTTGESLGLLIEESRVNLLTYSSDFSQGVWGASDASVSAAADIAPDGTQTAYKFIAAATTANHLLNRINVTTATSGVSYTLTCYAKSAEYSFIRLQLQSSAFAASAWANFNLSSGSVASVGGTGTTSITPVGNGWYRCSFTGVATSSSLFGVQPFVLNADLLGTSPSFLGNGYSGIFIWGAQLEAGAFATSYIPTVASQVTRAADAASMTGTNFSSWYNVGQGTLYAEAAISNTGTFSGSDLVGITNASGTGMELYKASNNAGMTIYAGTNSAVLTTSVPVGAFNKFALTQTGVISASGVYNGATPVSVTPTLYTPTLLGIGKNAGVANPLCCWTKRITYYPVALTSTQLVTLTT